MNMAEHEVLTDDSDEFLGGLVCSSDDAPVAVITGAARGLGRATALRMGSAGYRVVITARSSRSHRHPLFSGTIEDVRDDLERRGYEAFAIAADLADPHAIDEIYSVTMDRFGRCDALINNAAYAPVEPFLELSPSKWRAAITVNLWAPAALTRLFLPSMIERGSGAVINVGSGAAVENIPETAPYCVTKSALERLTEVIAAEVGDRGVTVACIRIAERISTEADSMMRSYGIGANSNAPGVTSPEQFADGVAWLIGKPEMNGRTLTLDELREFGAISH